MWGGLAPPAARYDAGVKRLGIAVVCLMACTFGAAGSGSKSDEPADTGGNEDTTADAAEADGMTVADGPDDGGGSGTGTVMPMTDEGPMTDDGPDPTTDTAPQTDTGPSESSGDSGEGTTGGMMVDPYGPCVAGCPDEGYGCSGGACAEPCGSDGDCDAPLGGNAVAECADPKYFPWCVLNCDADTSGCPEGMSCVDTRWGHRCMW